MNSSIATVIAITNNNGTRLFKHVDIPNKAIHIVHLMWCLKIIFIIVIINTVNKHTPSVTF